MEFGLSFCKFQREESFGQELLLLSEFRKEKKAGAFLCKMKRLLATTPVTSQTEQSWHFSVKSDF